MFCIGYFVIYLPRKTQFICTSGFQPSSAFLSSFPAGWLRNKEVRWLSWGQHSDCLSWDYTQTLSFAEPLGHTTPNQSIHIVGSNGTNCKCHFLCFIVLLVLKYCHFYEFRNITSVHSLVPFHFEQAQFFVMNLLPGFQMCISFTSSGVVIDDVAGLCCSSVLPQGRPCLTLCFGKGTHVFAPVDHCHKLLNTPGCWGSLPLEFTFYRNITMLEQDAQIW